MTDQIQLMIIPCQQGTRETSDIIQTARDTFTSETSGPLMIAASDLLQKANTNGDRRLITSTLWIADENFRHEIVKAILDRVLKYNISIEVLKRDPETLLSVGRDLDPATRTRIQQLIRAIVNEKQGQNISSMIITLISVIDKLIDGDFATLLRDLQQRPAFL